jgi:tRNA 2-selenouridine synthase
LTEFERQGHQTLDLEELASHRGSLLGTLPDRPQPTQKWFDSLLLARMRLLDHARPVWIEAESKKIGNLQIPESLFEAMHRSPVVQLSAPMAERVRLWREDYPHFAADPVGMVEKLVPLKPLVGGEVLASWQALAASGQVDALFESVMLLHYDPCYTRSTRRNYGGEGQEVAFPLQGLDKASLEDAVRRLAGQAG